MVYFLWRVQLEIQILALFWLRYIRKFGWFWGIWRCEADGAEERGPSSWCLRLWFPFFWNPLACQCQAVGFWKGGGAILCAARKRRRRDSGFRLECIGPALNWTCLWKDSGFRLESISPALIGLDMFVEGLWIPSWIHQSRIELDMFVEGLGFWQESISPALDMSLEGFCFANSSVKALTARAQCLSWILYDFVVGLILFGWVDAIHGTRWILGHMAEMWGSWWCPDQRRWWAFQLEPQPGPRKTTCSWCWAAHFRIFHQCKCSISPEVGSELQRFGRCLCVDPVSENCKFSVKLNPFCAANSMPMNTQNQHIQIICSVGWILMLKQLYETIESRYVFETTSFARKTTCLSVAALTSPGFAPNKFGFFKHDVFPWKIL